MLMQFVLNSGAVCGFDNNCYASTSHGFRLYIVNIYNRRWEDFLVEVARTGQQCEHMPRGTQRTLTQTVN